MNKQELVDAVAAEANISKSAANETIDATLEAISQAVTAGDTVQLIGFGSFSTGARAARTGRNPKTAKRCKSLLQRRSSSRQAKPSKIS